MSDETPDLSIVCTGDLVAELKNRHDCLIVIGEIDRSEDQTSWCQYTKGRISRLLGMVGRCRTRLAKYADSEEQEIQPDDPARDD